MKDYALVQRGLTNDSEQVDLKFINRYHHTWPQGIRLLTSGYLNLRPLVTHPFNLQDAVKALTSSADRGFGAIKVHIKDDYEQ